MLYICLLTAFKTNFSNKQAIWRIITNKTLTETENCLEISTNKEKIRKCKQKKEKHHRIICRQNFADENRFFLLLFNTI